MNRLCVLLLPALLCSAAPARGEFAPPPWERARDHAEADGPDRFDDVSPPRSTVRFSTGPAVAFGGLEPRGGLVFSLDAGSRGAGARLSGAWMRAGADHGLSEYAGELWVDFADHGPLHPILAAGAAVARLDRPGDTPDVESLTVGVGRLRGTLEYALPVRGVDARAGLDVSASVPAVGPKSSDLSPWVTAALRVGVGF